MTATSWEIKRSQSHLAAGSGSGFCGVHSVVCFFWERFFTLAAQRMRSPKKKTRDALPLTAEGTTATQQLPSCCQGRSQRERQPRPPLLSHQRGVRLCWRQRDQGCSTLSHFFHLSPYQLPAAVASPPPCRLCSKRPRLLLSLGPSTSMTMCLWWSRSAWARCDNSR
jgi:hypothetical protein